MLMTRKRLPLAELQKLIDPIFDKFLGKGAPDEVDDIAFGLELGRILERNGWSRDEFCDAMERMSNGATTEEADED